MKIKCVVFTVKCSIFRQVTPCKVTNHLAKRQIDITVLPLEDMDLAKIERKTFWNQKSGVKSSYFDFWTDFLELCFEFSIKSLLSKIINDSTSRFLRPNTPNQIPYLEQNSTVSLNWVYPVPKCRINGNNYCDCVCVIVDATKINRMKCDSVFIGLQIKWCCVVYIFIVVFSHQTYVSNSNHDLWVFCVKVYILCI